MTSNEDRIPEEEARAIWLRAAHLQAESERRAEERSRQLPIRVGDDAEGEGLQLDDVRAAAEGAGIGPEFVQIALAEATASNAPAMASAGSDLVGAKVFLGTSRRTIEETIAVPRSVAAVWAACLQVFAGHPCLLQAGELAELRSTSGRVIVFNVPPFDWSVTANPPFVEKAAMIGLKQLHAAIRPLASEPPTCEVVVAGDLHAGMRTRWRWSAASSVGGGAVGAAWGAGAAATVLPGALLAVLGAGLVGGAAVAMWAATYRYYQGQVARALRQTLQLLPAAARAITTHQGDQGTVALPRPPR
jgi:hypothetical protein